MNYCDGPIRPTKKEIEIDKNAVEKKDSFEKETVKPLRAKNVMRLQRMRLKKR